MIEYGPHSGDSQSLLGLSFLNLSSAKRQPAGFDKSKSFIVQRSTFRLAPSAVLSAVRLVRRRLLPNLFVSLRFVST